MSDPKPEDIADHRQAFLEQVNRDFEALRSNPDAWREYLEESVDWESTLVDGLDDE